MTTEQIQRNGFAWCRDAVAPEVVNLLREAISAAMHGEIEYSMRHVLERVPAVREWCDAPQTRALVEPILGKNCFPARGIVFDKTPDANWKVPWHQDLTIAVREKIDTDGFGPWSLKDSVCHVQPPLRVLETMLTTRLHLDDCDEDNGPLRVLPASHRAGKLDAAQIAVWREREAVACVAKSGDVLLMRPLLLHASSQAVASPSRVAHRMVERPVAQRLAVVQSLKMKN